LRRDDRHFANASIMTTPPSFRASFQDRREAGRELAQRLLDYKDRPDVVVFAVSQGGVPVAGEIARALGVPLDIFLVRKVIIPGYEGLVMGFVAREAYLVIKRAIERAAVPMTSFVAVASLEQEALDRQEAWYRDGRPALSGTGRCTILVDEGLTDGSLLPTAVDAMRRQGPARLVVAVPVTAPDVRDKLAQHIDEIVYNRTVDPASRFEFWFDDSTDVDDETVRQTLRKAAQRSAQ
jgi:putative phosphoribosyl transferase